MRHRLTVTAAAATVATSIVVYPLVSGAAWFWLGLAATVVVALTGTLTRLRPLPVTVCLLAQLAALLLYLNIVFASAVSFAGVAPTTSSLGHVLALARRGMNTVHHYAPPVPARPGILLLTAAGIGLVAILTDLLAVRLRRPALAGLPLLVLFCVPLSTPARPGPVGTAVGFGLSVAGYLALLSADGREKVRLWGRLVSVWDSGRADAAPETRKLAAAGRRLGVAAAVLALFVPLLLPGRPAHRLLGGSGGGSGSGGHGGATIYLPNPLAVLNEQLHESRPQTVLTYRTTDASPPYLQVYVLGQLSPGAWSLGRDVLAASVPVDSGRLPPPPGLAPQTPGPALRERITLSGGLASGTRGLSYLPVPYPARSISVAGDWRADRQSLTVFGATSLSGLTYSVTAKDVNPSPQQLRGAAAPPPSVAAYLPVPQAFAGLLPLAQRITANRSSAYGRAVALQRWFTQTGHFTYSLNVAPTRSANALINFLTRSKRGYCQQFAFGMAVLARLLGIPSRVVIGYTQGTFLGGSLWRVTTRDAHAWPELYFQGAGWLRFEPTPDGSAGPGQPTATAPSYSYPAPIINGVPTTPATAAPGAGTTGTPSNSRELAGNLRAHIGSDGPAGAGRTARHHPFPAGWLVAGLLALALISPRSARSVIRHRRWRTAASDPARAEAAWQEVTDDLTDHGIISRASESPRRVAERVAGRLRLTAQEQAALGRVAAAVERARYARTPPATPTVRADVALIRRGLARSAGRGVRWRARLFPASALRPFRAGLARVLDVLGWLDRLTTRTDGRAFWQLAAGRRGAD